MSVRFDVDYRQIRELEEKMMRLPNVMEKTVNDTLHSFGIRTAVEEITKLIKISTQNGRVRSKRHAKTSNWSKSEKHNLSFTIKARGGAAKRKGSFGYLVFPNEGRGSSNPIEQRFAERGMDAATPKILRILNKNIDKKIREAL